MIRRLNRHLNVTEQRVTATEVGMTEIVDALRRHGILARETEAEAA